MGLHLHNRLADMIDIKNFVMRNLVIYSANDSEVNVQLVLLILDCGIYKIHVILMLISFLIYQLIIASFKQIANIQKISK